MTTKTKTAITVILLGVAAALTPIKSCDLPIPVINDPPIKADGLHVLVLEETADRNLLPSGQVAVMTSTRIRRAVQEADGEMLVLDVSSDLSRLPQYWQDAAARERTTLPWWIVSGDSGGVEEPLPSSVEQALSTIATYAPDGE